MRCWLTVILAFIQSLVYVIFLLLIKESGLRMCYSGSDAASSHAMSRPQQYLIGNIPQLIAYKHIIM